MNIKELRPGPPLTEREWLEEHQRALDDADARLDARVRAGKAQNAARMQRCLEVTTLVMVLSLFAGAVFIASKIGDYVYSTGPQDI